MLVPMPTSTVENYLKAILRLSEDLSADALVPVGKVAECLGLTPGTATMMMKHLERDGYGRYVPRKGVMLTEKGRAAALQVLRRHRLIELFLVEVMKLDWSEVHQEAEILEHVLSDRLVERIDDMLGHPGYDPHGDPIPDANGVVRPDSLRVLKDCEPGNYHLVRVAHDDPALLQWLQQRHLMPGAFIRVVEHDPLAGILTLQLTNATSLQIGRTLAAALWVRHTDPANQQPDNSSEDH